VLFRGQGGRDTWRLRDDNREYRIEVTGSLEVDEIPALHTAVRAEIGIGPLSLSSGSRAEGLVRVLRRFTYAHLPISLVSPSTRLEPARVVLLRNFLAEKVSSSKCEHTRHVEWEVSSQESRTFAGEIHSSLSPRLIRLSAIRDPLDLIGLGGAAALGVFVDLFRHAIITWIGTGTAQPKSVLAAATRAM
jgi:hypothetical protein